MLVSSPERYRFPGPADPIRVVSRWREEGVAVQVDAGSLQGSNGAGTAGIAWRLATEGLVDVLASNHQGNRSPRGLVPAARLAAFRLGPAEAARLAADNPRAILEDRPVEALDRSIRRMPGGDVAPPGPDGAGGTLARDSLAMEPG